MSNTTTLMLAGAAAAAALALGSPARAEERTPMNYCSSVYQPNDRGNCEYQGPVSHGPCQPGTHFQVFPNGNGYRCQQDGY